MKENKWQAHQRQLESQEASNSQIYRDRQFTFNNKQSFENNGQKVAPATANQRNSQHFLFHRDGEEEQSMTAGNMSSFQTQPQTLYEQPSSGGAAQQSMQQSMMAQSALPLQQPMSQPIEQFGQMIKIVLVGESGVGKTALVHRYMKNTMPPETLRSTVAVEFGTRKIVLKHRPYKVQVVLWDTAGQERFKSLTTHHYQGAHGALLVFDVTSTKSFDRARSWVEELTQNTPIGCKTALVTNKCDLAFREVPEEEVRSFAHQNNLLYYETSSWWNRDDDESVFNADGRGGIGVLIDSMVEEIIDDIVTERFSIVYNTQGMNASEYQDNTSPRSRAMPFSIWEKQRNQYGPNARANGRVSSAVRLDQAQPRTLYEVEEEQSGCGC